ncbi:PREDICTED: very long-chain acyl-CoA synthetase-like [Branchiostoma belcheri]|uniref:long-chain-fatty-acid--CoA ligase n=1 Tax=Branchiostoma belcheri TaxID=7741 RepID=A0A6P5ABT2_BRABE|nr:PREDICTED: very long-chain acyl-CoA synthetase-like [Branchiostoma belcheri]
MVKPIEAALYAALGGISTAVATLNVVYPQIRQDLKFLRKVRGPLSRYRRYISAQPPVTIVDRFLHQVQLQPDKDFILFEDEVYSYKDVDVMSNKVANFFREEGLKCGDTVAMLVYNEPAFVWTFLGLAKLGVKMALLNTNLRSRSLLHCFTVSEAKALIVGQGDVLLEATMEILPALAEHGITVWLQGDQPAPQGIISLDDKINQASDQPIPVKMRESITAKDALCYIYTSGTTGLPKAAKITTEKVLGAGCFFGISDLKNDDVVYITLPLYHSNGLFFGLAGTIEHGTTMALARKFSATRFWDDCRKYNATIVLYIGELLRYLCAQPKTPFDRNHGVRLAFGNGLRPDIWEKFQERFGVGQIVEFYGATEGNVSFFNIFNKTGAVGMATPLFKRIRPASFLKVDPETSELVRDQNGRCIPVKLGEPGLLVSAISDTFPFEGYKGERKITERKILRNVFKEGDMFFNTGDLMMVDKDYYVYFIDRLGDTYRWKGENVATTEVAEVLHDIEEIQEANVYGVTVPGHDGRAGMAAIVLHPGHRANPRDWYSHVALRLPVYARPLFLRLTRDLDHTGTFKQTKPELVREGFDPSVVTDSLYFRDDSKETYVPLDLEVYKSIVVGKAKL